MTSRNGETENLESFGNSSEPATEDCDFFKNMKICGICTPTPKRLPGFSMSCSVKKTNLIPNLANAMIASGWYTRDPVPDNTPGLSESLNTVTSSTHVMPGVKRPTESGLFNQSLRTTDNSCHAFGPEYIESVTKSTRESVKNIKKKFRKKIKKTMTPHVLHVNGRGETSNTGFKSRTSAIGLKLTSAELLALKRFRRRALAATSKKFRFRNHGHSDRLCLDSGATHTLLKRDSMVRRILNRVRVHIKDAVGNSHPSTVSGLLNVFVKRQDGSHMLLPSSGTAHVLPSLMHNLLSVSQLCEHGCTVVLKKQGSKIIGPHGDVIPVAEENGLYFVPTVDSDDSMRVASLPPLITGNAVRARRAMFSSIMSEPSSLSSLLTEA